MSEKVDKLIDTAIEEMRDILKKEAARDGLVEYDDKQDTGEVQHG